MRYGNAMGSRGSVIPFFKSICDAGGLEFPITDPKMTRFMISLEQGVDLVWTFLKIWWVEKFMLKIPL